MLRPRESKRGGRGETIQPRQNGRNGQHGKNGPNGLGQRQSAPVNGGRARSSGVIARIAALGSLGAAIVLIVLVLFSGGSTYTLRANFQDAGGLVTGNQVFIGPATVGSVKSIGLTPDGQAEVTLGIDSKDAPLPEGTVARIYENSLSGIANKYVVLEPGTGATRIPDGGTIRSSHTYSQVNLDQLFDTLAPKTRAGLRGFIRGEAASISGRAPQASRTLQYFAPALVSTSNVTQELARSEPQFDSLLVQGAQTMQALAARTSQLTQLVSNTNATTAAIAGQSQNLEQALTLLAPTLNHSTSTFAGLRSTLDTLDPLVVRSIPASRRLAQFVAALRQLTDRSIPTIGSLNALIRNPSGTGDLISLLQAAPSLARVAQASFPRQIKVFNDSQPQVDYFREFTPDVVAALSDIGQIGGYFDANGHYARTQPWFGTFGLNSANQLTDKPPSLRYQGLQVARTRCPGSAAQPSPDGSSPRAVPGCSKANVPPGP
jgi:phospholipid/cholesterol/gamma-HCH transport system substrate-binding protein